MKRYIIFLNVLLMCLASAAQTKPNYYGETLRRQGPGYIADSGLHAPVFYGTPTIRHKIWDGPGAIGVDSLNHRFYFYSGGVQRRLANYSELISFSSDSNWRVRGNSFSLDADLWKMGTKSNHKLWFITNDTDRIYIPNYGIIRDDTSSRLVMLVLDSVTKRWAYKSIPSGGGSNKVDSNAVRNDSLFYYINGTEFFVKRLQPYGSYVATADTAAMLASYMRLQRFLDSMTNHWAAIQNKWSLTGNSGTTPTHFLGTTDNKPVLIKTNNKPAVRIDSLQKLQANKISSLTDTLSDYEIIVFPDLQHMDGVGYPSANFDAGRSMFDWVVANKTNENIQAVIGVGDMTEEANNTAEWDTLNVWYGKLDAAGVRYVTPPGNHDYNNRFTMFSTGRDLTSYNTNFGASRYSGKPYFVDAFHGYENSLYSFDVGTRKYAIFSLEFHPTDSALNWVGNKCDSLLLADPERQVIITTHAYIRAQGEKATDSDPSSVNAYSAGAGGVGYDNSGVEQWDKLYKKKKNIRYIFSGHYIYNGFSPLKGFSHRIVSSGENGNLVEQIYINYQDDDNGGNGYFLRLKFRPDSNDVKVSYYSSYLSQEDPIFPSFTIQEPSIQIESSLGVKGSLSINDQFRVEGAAKFGQLTRGRIPYIDYDGRLRDTADLRYSLDTARVLIGSPTDDLISKVQVNGAGKFSGELTGYPVVSSSIGRPTGFTSSLPGTAYIVHGASNYGLTVTRAANDAGGASLSFYKTRNATPTAKTGASYADIQGQVLFHSIGSDNSTVNISERWEVVAATIGTSYVSSQTRIRGIDPGGSLKTKFILDENGRALFGDNILSNPTTSSALEIRSSDKGVLFPNLSTTQQNAISSPASWLHILNTDSSSMTLYNGSSWLSYATRNWVRSLGYLSGLTIGTTTIANSVSGSVLYDSSGVLSRNDDFYWDRTNKRLGIGTNNPSAKLHVSGTTRFDLGSDATGDMFYRDASGFFTRLAVGTAGQHLVGGTTPHWVDTTAGGGGGYTNLTQFVGQNNWKVFYSDGNGDVQELSIGTSGKVLTSNGASSAPSWETPAAISYSRLVKTLTVDVTDVGNVGGGEDDLMTWTVPADTLSNNGDYIDFEMSFVFGENTNNKTVKIYWAGVNIYSSGAQPQQTGNMVISGKIIRTGATSQKIVLRQLNNTTNYNDETTYITGSATLSAGNILKATGEATANDDIVQKTLTVVFNPNH